MSGAKQFEDLIAWQKARELTNLIYRLTRTAPFQHDFSLVNQIRRSSISVMSNIAEGYERQTRKELIHFLFVAKGSAGEVRSQLITAHDQHYLNDEDFETAKAFVIETSKTIAGFIRYLHNQSY